MKKYLVIVLVLFTVAALAFNLSDMASKTVGSPLLEEVGVRDEFGEMHKDNWREALLEFGDEADTLDSLDYVPEFLR